MVNFCLQSCTFCLWFILVLTVWIRICTLNAEQQSCRIRIQCGSGFPTLLQYLCCRQASDELQAIFEEELSRCSLAAQQELGGNTVVSPSGLWIRIRMDPHLFFLLDPEPGKKICKITTEKARKFVIVKKMVIKKIVPTFGPASFSLGNILQRV